MCTKVKEHYQFLILTWADWRVSYSMYPYPLCLPGTPALARSQNLIVPNAENTDRMSSSDKS